MEKNFFTDIERLLPTQPYLSKTKLNEVQKHFESHALEDYPPLKVISFGGKTILLEGHHIAFYIASQGKNIAKVIECRQCSLLFSLKLQNKCRKSGIHTIGGLAKKILDDAQYEEKWIKSYEKMRSSAELRPLAGLRCKDIYDGAQKIRIADTIMTPIPEYFANEFIYKNYIRKSEDMYFLSFVIYGYPIAFAACRKIYDDVLEIYMLGICRAIGSKTLSNRIMKEIFSLAKKLGRKYISVKVPNISAVKNKVYKLYDFYCSYGFSHIENLESPWDEKRLCMLLLRHEKTHL
jgi:hypothetical protein